MRQIVGYYIAPPGDLWVRFQGGEMRLATERERGTILSLPGMPTSVVRDEAQPFRDPDAASAAPACHAAESRHQPVAVGE